MKALHAPANQSRRAALMTHALPPEDQAWLLAALPPARRMELQGLVAELRELGMPADPELLDGLETQEAPAPAPRGTMVLEKLTAQQVRALAQVLQREGAGVAAILLALRSWAWSDALFAEMARDFANEVRQCAARPPASALADALCSALHKEMEASLPTVGRASGMATWQRVRTAMSWTRRRA